MNTILSRFVLFDKNSAEKNSLKTFRKSDFSKFYFLLILVTTLLINISSIRAQGLDVNTCPTIDKRSNGNGQYGLAAGTFPGYGQNNPVAVNVVGTPYQTVSYDPASKTGNVNFKWSSTTIVNKLPVITRVWITARGATNGALSAIKFGPPPPPTRSGQAYYASYNFYNQNMPAAGKVTLEFADPVTNIPAFYCTFDLQQNTTTTPPVIDCGPTITFQPINTNTTCEATTASFSVTASGVGTYQWQVSENNGTTFTNLSNSGNYSGVNTATLNIANPSLYDSNLYRVVLSNSTCASVTSNSALLTSKSKPSAAFQSFNDNCGIESKNIGINLTGTGPWSITYTATPISGSPSTQTISNIQSSPYYLRVTPTQQTSYQITNVSDKFCSNVYSTSNTSNTFTIYPKPSINPINDTICSGTNSFQLRFTTTGSPNKYSISAGQRALPSFVNTVDANITGNNISITIPNGSTAGDYDFVVSAKNSVTGCISDSKNITLKIVAPTTMELSANRTLFCSGDSIILNATSAGFSSYTWTSTAGHSISNISNPKVRINAATTFTVTGTDLNGCTSSASLTLTPAAGSSVSISPTNTTICFGSSVALVANNGSNYTWSPSTGLSTTTGSTVIASPSTTTTYTVTSTNDAGCTSTAQVVVTVSNQNVSISPASTTLCEGGTVTLTASGGSNYTWYPSTGLSTTTGSTVIANPANTTTYFVRSEDAGGCVKIASVTVTVSKNPVDRNTSTPNNLLFCTQGITSFPLTVDVTETGTTRSWAYSTTLGSPYTYFSQDTTVNGILFDMSNASVNNSTLTISGYGNSAYGGPRYFRLKIVGASCTYYYDMVITDTKGTQPAAPTADKSSVCINEGTVLRAGKVSLGSSIQWQSSNSASTGFTDIVGATSDTLATGPLSANKYYRIAISGATASCNDESNSILISITPALSANTISSSITCTDPKVSSVTITGSTVTGADYQWQSSTTSSSTGFSDILGQQAKDYTLPTNVVANTTWYRRVVSTNACSASPSATVVLYAPISNNQISSTSNTYCDSASSVILTGTTPAGGSGSYTYVWQRSSTSAETGFTDIASATNANYTITKSYSTNWYRRIITSGSCIDTSEAYKVSVYTSSNVTVSANTSICAGSSVTLSASGATSYSWSPSTGLSSTIGSYVIANPATTTTYTVTGTNANGCTKTAQVTVTVNASPNTPVLSTSSKTVCSTDGSFDISSLVQSTDAVEWYTVPVVNASFKISNTVRSSSGTFYAFAKNGTCYSANYATLELTFVNTSKPDVSATNIRLCSPETFNLTSLQPANRVGVTYRWYTTNDHNAANEVSNSSSVGTGTYYLFAYSAAGNCFGPASNAVSVVVNAVTTASVTTTTLNVCTSSPINLNDYNATSGNNIYNWYTVASNPTINDLVLNPQSVSTSGTYYLYATNSSGCTGPASQGLTVNFNTSPSANIGTVNSYCGQASRTISVTTNAASALYRWQVSTNNAQSWTNLSNNSVYSGVTTATLTINNTTSLDGYLYRVNVQNSTNTCNTLSEYVVLVEELPMTIASQPSSKLIGIGDTTILNVSIGGSPTGDYQWKVSTNNGASFTNLVDNANYVGANSNPLIIIGAPVTFNGNLYKCEISNYCDTVVSNAAQLLVSNTPNQAPIAGNDTKTINEDQPTTGSLTSNDSDPDNDALTYSVINNTDKGTLVLNPNGTYTYTPNANANGTDTLIYKVCDSGTPTKCDTARLVITITPVNDAPVANSDTIRKTTNEDEPIVICVPANDVEGNRIDVSSVSSLDKGTSSSTTGIDSCFTYTPNPNVNGNDTVRVIISDGNGGFDTVQIIITITPVNDPPVALNDTKITNEDQIATGTLATNDSDPENNTLSFSILTNTKKGIITVNTNGTYSYVPNANYFGTDTLIYKVCDNGTPSKCDTAQLVITISPVNDAPKVPSDTIRRTTNEDQPIVICVAATDAEKNRIDISSVSALNKGTASSTTGVDSCFTFIPTPNANGLDTIRVIINDGQGGFDTLQVIINILPVNDPPVATNDTKTINEDQATSGTVATNDTDLENDLLTFSVLDYTDKGTITLNPNGSYTYTPNANVSGNDTLIYLVCDNGSPSKCDTGILVITIAPVNDAPNAINDAKTINEDQVATGTVATNDTDPENGVLTFSIVDNTNKGNIQLNPNGTYTYTPNANANGTDTLTYIVCDNGTPSKCDTAILVITITPVNDPPKATDDVKTVNEDGTTNGTIASNDTDPENDLLFFSVLDFTDKGTIVLNPNGTYSYTPNANVTGTDTLIYLVCDNGSPSRCDTGMLVITINPVNDPPVAINDAKTINEDQVATGTVATNDTDPENDALTFSIVSNPNKGNILLNANGTYTYTPNLNANGIDTLVYKVCDNGTPSRCDTALLIININAVNDAPNALSDTIRRTTPEDEPVVICIPALDVEGNTIDVTDIRFQSLGTTSSTNGTDSCFTYTPNPNVNGNDTIRVIISDGKGGFDTVQVIITITPVNDPPRALSDTIRRTTPEDQPIVICIPAIDNDKNRIDISAINNLTLGTSSNVSSLDSCFTYTPNPNTTGLDTIQVIISDGNGGFDTVQVIINITPVNDPPQAISDTIRRTTPEDEPIVICIEALDLDKDRIDVHNISALTLGSVSNIAGTDSCFTYFPNPNVNGIDTFRVIISDGKGGFDTVQVILTITPVNDKPVAINDDKSLLENTIKNGSVAPNDSDVDNDPLSFTLLNSTIHGSIILNSDGSYTYTPATHFFGTDSAKYIVCDNGTPSLCDTATLYLYIGSVNVRPEAVNDTVITEMNKSITINVAENDIDVDNDPLTFVYANAKHGKYVVESKGVITYNPKFNFIGLDSIRYILCDQNLCDTATIYVDVQGKLNPTIGAALAVSEPIILTPETYNITYTITVKNYGDVDLRNVRITEDLKKVFPAPAEFNILEITEPTGFAINPNFDGINNIELLDSTNSTLLIGESKQIELKVFIKPNATVVNYSNSVTAYGTGNLILSDSTVSDISVAGLDPDPDGDGVPNETGTTETQLKMFVPNGFSPDGDGINDAFIIKGIENYPNNTLTIFNRWGNKVYEESPYRNGWTGNSKNASGLILSEGVLPIGTYFYIIDFGVEGLKAQTGFVVIKK